MSSILHAPRPGKPTLRLVEAPSLPPTIDFPVASEAAGFPGLADWIDSIAGEIRDRDSEAATWLARKVAAIAEEARFLGAETPDDFEGRAEIWAADLVRMERDRIEAQIEVLADSYSHPMY